LVIAKHLQILAFAVLHVGERTNVCIADSCCDSCKV